MIKIELHHHKAFIKEYSTQQELETLREKLRFFIRNFLPIQGKQYTVENLLSDKDFSFPSGYTTVLEKILKSKDIELEIDDKRTYPAPFLNLKAHIELPPLFETQVEALAAITKNNIGIIASATGSGKSRIILETLMMRRVKTLILVPTEDIKMNLYELYKEVLGAAYVSDVAPSMNDEFPLKKMQKEVNPEPASNQPVTKDPLAKIAKLFSSNQKASNNNQVQRLGKLFSKDSFKDNNLESPEAKYMQGKIESEGKDARKKAKELRKLEKKFEKKSKEITIICYQSLGNISERFLSEIEMLVIDEAHTASVAQIRSAAMKMPKAAYRYFFTATPWRDMKAQMHLLLSVIGDNIIYELKGKTAADKAIIATPHLTIYDAPKPNVYLDPKKLKNPRQRKVQGIIANESRNAFIVEKCIEMFYEGHNVFIAVDEIEHLKILEERFNHQKIDVNIIHGELNSLVKRERVKKAGTATEPMITIGTMAVGVGTDMPNVDCVFLASGGKSSIRWIQRIGRGSRKTKKDFYVYDLKDWFNDRLNEHSYEREKIYKEEFEEFKNLESRFNLYSKN